MALFYHEQGQWKTQSLQSLRLVLSFLMFSLTKLNHQQHLAAKHIHGPLLILAGAGSGKTRTITFRIAHMIENCHIPPSQILAVSFTNKAAAEMKQRVKKLLSARKTKGITLSTFHSLGIQILKHEIHHLGYSKQFAIYDVSDQISVLRDIMKHYKAGHNFHLKTLQAKISQLKNASVTPETYIKSSFFDPHDDYDMAVEYAYQKYQEKLQYFNAIDFDDILNLTVKLFDNFPDIAKKYSQKFQYIMIDEYQDTNDLQFRLISHLTSTHNNLCVVGDDDQAIYAFRGANIQNILNFEKQFSDATVIKLEQNYRSTMPILELANHVISQNKMRKDKKMWSQTPSDKLPFLWAAADSDHETVIICEEINKLQNDGILLHDMAILYRSNTQIPLIEDQLRLYRIPYKIIGGQKLYEKKEIKDIIAYLALINNPKNEIALRRILNVPTRGIGMTSLQQMLDLAKENQTTLYQTLKNEARKGVHPRSPQFRIFTSLISKYQDCFKDPEVSLQKTIENLIEDIHYHDHIIKSYDKQDKIIHIKQNDLRFFTEAAGRFQAHFGKEGTLNNLLDKLLLTDSQDEQKDGEESAISLMTFHSSKGLEFHTVFMMGTEEGLLPHKKVIDLDEDISEECRLTYVGITRAEKNLYMTYAKERNIYGKNQPRHLSRFINNVDEKLYCFQDKTTFDYMTEDEEKDYKENFFSNMMSLLDDD